MAIDPATPPPPPPPPQDESAGFSQGSNIFFPTAAPTSTDNPLAGMDATTRIIDTNSDGDVTMSDAEDLQEKHFEALRQMARRPGLGVGEVIPRVLRAFTLTPEEAKRALPHCREEDGDFSCAIATLVEGDAVFVLEMDFYGKLRAWLSSAKIEPLAGGLVVDNTRLFDLYESIDRPGQLKAGLEEGRDYVLVRPDTWSCLMEWFGGGPSIQRRCVKDKERIVIDLRGLEIRAKRSSRPTKFLRFVVSKYDTVAQLKEKVVEDWVKDYAASPDLSLYRVWDFLDDKCQQRLEPNSAQLATFMLEDGQSVMFEEADPETKIFAWDPERGETLQAMRDAAAAASFSGNAISSIGTSSTSITYGNSSSAYSYKRKVVENSVVSSRKPVSAGIVGLSNLGNTCFMNSTLQCLSHTWMLRKHFTSDAYLAEINANNPLGTGGKLAKSFGELMKLMWSNEGDIISPAGFKSQMAEFKAEFSGYQQHDSQELLSFLLDGLHEDLNRILVKPMTNAVEANGRPDEEVAAECKSVHRLRNDSIISDLFEGVYRSTVVCPDCGKKSVTFDPFSVIQLPVTRPARAGAKKLVPISVTVLNAHTFLPPPGSAPLTLRVAADALVYELRASIASSSSSSSAEDLVLCTMRNARIDKILEDEDQLDHLMGAEEIVAFVNSDAACFRAKQLTAFNGTWHRPLTSRRDLPNMAVNATTTTTSPFSKGEVWIGSVDHRKMRMRMEVTDHSEFGLWKQGLGHFIRCTVDISPLPYVSPTDKQFEGVEENAYEAIGFVKQEQEENGVPPSSSMSFSCKFETVRSLGSFGSFHGKYPHLDASKLYELVGTCSSARDFFFGSISEKKPPSAASTTSSTYYSRYTSSYTVSQPFTLTRQAPGAAAAALSQQTAGKIGPCFPFTPPGDDCNANIYPITLFHKYVYDNVAQPALLFLDSTTYCSPKRLYDLVVRHCTARIRLRNTLGVLMESGETGEDDPFGLRALFTVTLPKQGHIKLSATDDETNIFALHQSLLTLAVEWDSKALSKTSPLYARLFSLLYSENGDAGLGEDATLAGNRLQDCFDLFSEEEKLTPSEAWYCGNCKDHKEAFKRMEIWDLADVLVIQLKRFSQSHSSYTFDKDDTEVDFPLEGLDLNARVRHKSSDKDGSYIYDLVAVSHHYGGLGGGHYIAHARDESDGTWYELDDSSVRVLGANSASAAPKIKRGSAYVLFYVKREKTPASWWRLREAPPPASAL